MSSYRDSIFQQLITEAPQHHQKLSTLFVAPIRTSLRLQKNDYVVETHSFILPFLVQLETTKVRFLSSNSAKLAEISAFWLRPNVDTMAGYNSTIMPHRKSRKRPQKGRKTPIFGPSFVIRVQHSRASSRVSLPEHPFNPHHGGNGRRRCHNDHRNKTSAFTLIMTQTLHTNAAAAAAARRAR